MRSSLLVFAAMLALAGCGRNTEAEEESPYGLRAALERPSLATVIESTVTAKDPAEAEVYDEQSLASTEPAANTSGGDKASQPAALIAYSYGLTYRLGGQALAPLQSRQTALCTSLGPTRCRVVSSSLVNNRSSAAGEARYASNGQTKFLIDARIAQPFMAKLDAAAAGAGGSVADRRVDSEDVTKQVIDTNARVRAKQALADRLVKLINTGNAKVGDLVAAERAFAQTQEELDAARSLQATLRQRVSMSEVSVNYTTTAAARTWGQVGDQFAAAGGILAGSIAALITFVIAVLPWALALILLVWLIRRFGWRPRWPWRRRDPAPPAA